MILNIDKNSLNNIKSLIKQTWPARKNIFMTIYYFFMFHYLYAQLNKNNRMYLDALTIKYSKQESVLTFIKEARKIMFTSDRHVIKSINKPKKVIIKNNTKYNTDLNKYSLKEQRQYKIFKFIDSEEYKLDLIDSKVHDKNNIIYSGNITAKTYNDKAKIIKNYSATGTDIKNNKYTSYANVYSKINGKYLIIAVSSNTTKINGPVLINYSSNYIDACKIARTFLQEEFKIASFGKSNKKANSIKSTVNKTSAKVTKSSKSKTMNFDESSVNVNIDKINRALGIIDSDAVEDLNGNIF